MENGSSPTWRHKDFLNIWYRSLHCPALPPFSRCQSSSVCSPRRRFGGLLDTCSVRLLVAEEAEALLFFLGGSLTSDMGTSLKSLSIPTRASSFCTILNSSSVKRSCPGPQPRKQALGRARFFSAFAVLFGMTSAFLLGMALGSIDATAKIPRVVTHPTMLLHLSS